jgi:hypothetical protein
MILTDSQNQRAVLLWHSPELRKCLRIPTCSCVRLLTTSDCFIEITELGTLATTTGMYLPAFQAEYLYIPPNGKVSAIQVSAAGTLYITPFIS